MRRPGTYVMVLIAVLSLSIWPPIFVRGVAHAFFIFTTSQHAFSDSAHTVVGANLRRYCPRVQ
jgi:hypothetical protein